MGAAIGAMLASAVGLAISPPAPVAVVLVLGTPRARTNGPALAAGWVVGLSGVVGTVLAVGIGLGAGDGHPARAARLELVLGAVLRLCAIRGRRRRPRAGRVTAPPPWMRTADRLTAGSSFGLALGLAVADPKNLAVAAGGAVSVAATGAGPGGTALAAGLLVLIGSPAVLVPLGATGPSGSARPARSASGRPGRAPTTRRSPPPWRPSSAPSTSVTHSPAWPEPVVSGDA
ncbi:GAP family protein [Streptomyces sp. NRRL B-24484]|uniref:GAP family protein n=1 Tax=Streptomyces sp. NRRL B-24484 TaxID=1463833 RepID=UPI000A5E9D79|nr:GAP family protein [Streptomyces sp. NRRL B-24484]